MLNAVVPLLNHKVLQFVVVRLFYGSLNDLNVIKFASHTLGLLKKYNFFTSLGGLPSRFLVEAEKCSEKKCHTKKGHVIHLL